FRFQLPEKGWRDVIDPAGHDHLVVGRILFPAIIAVSVLGHDRSIFGIAAPDEAVVEAARSRGEGWNDFDRPHLVGQIGEHRRLIARAGSHFEHFFSRCDSKRVRHPAYGVWSRYGDPEADVQM